MTAKKTTIKVKSRPTTNSNGQPLAQTKEADVVENVKFSSKSLFREKTEGMDGETIKKLQEIEDKYNNTEFKIPFKQFGFNEKTGRQFASSDVNFHHNLIKEYLITAFHGLGYEYASAFIAKSGTIYVYKYGVGSGEEIRISDHFGRGGVFSAKYDISTLNEAKEIISKTLPKSEIDRIEQQSKDERKKIEEIEEAKRSIFLSQHEGFGYKENTRTYQTPDEFKSKHPEIDGLRAIELGTKNGEMAYKFEYIAPKDGYTKRLPIDYIDWYNKKFNKNTIPPTITINGKERITTNKNQHEINQAIEQLIGEKGEFGSYTSEQKEFIRSYTGSGGLANQGATGKGILYEFFTPEYICNLMYELAYAHGYDGGNVLEPSCGTGELIRPAKDYSKVWAFEINKTSAAITSILYPGVQVFPDYFETAFMQSPRFTNLLKYPQKTWLKGYPFSLVIGNPPYGRYQSLFSRYFNKRLFAQVEIFFIIQGLELLKPGGLLIYLQSSNFLRNGDKYNEAKEYIDNMAEFVDAYRLPSVFKYSEVPTDIMILRKK